MNKHSNRIYTLLIALSFFITTAYGQINLNKDTHRETFTYAQKDTSNLKLDVYYNGLLSAPKPTIIFVFGGAFLMGRRDDKLYQTYFNTLAENNFKVISIDYRLGLKGKKYPTALNTRPLKDAIDTAVTDLFDATAYVIKNARKLGVDTSKIILSGSSSGGVTALHADWNMRNSTALSKKITSGFQFKGVIAFAGAIMSYSGKPSYKIPPAPTMMYHGTIDRVVPYKKIRLFNRGLFSSASLAKIFKKHQYPYYFESVEGMGHEIAGLPMTNNIKDILWFIENYIDKKRPLFMEVDFHDADLKPTFVAPPPNK